MSKTVLSVHNEHGLTTIELEGYGVADDKALEAACTLLRSAGYHTVRPPVAPGWLQAKVASKLDADVLRRQFERDEATKRSDQTLKHLAERITRDANAVVSAADVFARLTRTHTSIWSQDFWRAVERYSK